MKVNYGFGVPDYSQTSSGKSPPVAGTRRYRSERAFFRTTTWKQRLDDLDAVAGIIALGLLTVIIVVSAFLLLIQVALVQFGFSIPLRIGSAIGLIAMAILQFRTCAFVISGLTEAAHPRSVQLALRQRFRCNWQKAVIGFWWMINAVSIIALGEFVTFFVRVNTTTEAHATWIYRGFVFLTLLGSSFMANTFILLAGALLRRRRSSVLFIWRIRVLIDLGCTLVVFGISQSLPLERWAPMLGTV